MERSSTLVRQENKKEEPHDKPAVHRAAFVSGYSFGLRRCGDIQIEQLHEKGGKFLFVCRTCAEVFPF